MRVHGRQARASSHAGSLAHAAQRTAKELTRRRACLQFLCDGLEQDVAMRKAGLSTTELLTVASGKMLLLHKLLPKLHSEGHKANS